MMCTRSYLGGLSLGFLALLLRTHKGVKVGEDRKTWGGNQIKIKRLRENVS